MIVFLVIQTESGPHAEPLCNESGPREFTSSHAAIQAAKRMMAHNPAVISYYID